MNIRAAVIATLVFPVGFALVWSAFAWPEVVGAVLLIAASCWVLVVGWLAIYKLFSN